MKKTQMLHVEPHVLVQGLGGRLGGRALWICGHAKFWACKAGRDAEAEKLEKPGLRLLPQRSSRACEGWLSRTWGC